jgi:hypothetical protein
MSLITMLVRLDQTYPIHHHHPPPHNAPHFQQLFYHINPSFERQLPRHAEVSWRPPQTYLHYHLLYCSIYEYLRAPPTNQHRADAAEYLVGLQGNLARCNLISSEHRLQVHRIIWTLEWLKALPDDSGECSDADTVENA